ncbi:glutathione S-transferase 1-like [Mytilus californianus]|uniref:glutathione S-transferase 1-like n=1 Tax=Mytilus californianus TaxID=6549 RepID=UPI002245A9E2|nr:glutathione S-transferase 1-like [Mytilus californianus]
MAAKYKLSYFEERGRGEVLRLMFAGAGQEFEDDRLKGDSWAAFKPKTPYGQMPVLTVDNKTMINQTGAIARFIAREFGMYGTNNMENTKCDVIFETINDMFTEMIKVFFEKDEAKMAENNKKLNTEVLPKFFAFMAKLLKENGGKCLVGSKLSVADVAFFDILDKITEGKSMGAGLYKDFADIKTFYENVQKLPKIKSYLEKRQPSDI